MKKGLMLALLGAAAFVVLLVITAPASLLAYAIQRSTPVQLQGVGGSLWHGTAQQVIAPELQLGPLNWRLHGWPLLLGEVRLSLEIPAGTPNLSGKAEVGANILRKLSLSDVDITADAEWLFTQAALPLAAGGRFHLQIQSAEFHPEQLPRLNAQLDWQDARIVYPQAYELGGYRLIMHEHPATNPEYLLGELKDIDSPFKIDGTIKIERNGDYKFAARLATAPGAPEIFENTLLFVGTPETDGSVLLERNGNIFEDYGL
jgi:general secretion pathway protein N